MTEENTILEIKENITPQAVEKEESLISYIKSKNKKTWIYSFPYIFICLIIIIINSGPIKSGDSCHYTGGCRIGQYMLITIISVIIFNILIKLIYSIIKYYFPKSM